jgi:hypothetical protein
VHDLDEAVTTDLSRPIIVSWTFANEGGICYDGAYHFLWVKIGEPSVLRFDDSLLEPFHETLIPVIQGISTVAIVCWIFPDVLTFPLLVLEEAPLVRPIRPSVSAHHHEVYESSTGT